MCLPTKPFPAEAEEKHTAAVVVSFGVKLALDRREVANLEAVAARDPGRPGSLAATASTTRSPTGHGHLFRTFWQVGLTYRLHAPLPP
jgi:hypothetical protein